MPLTVNCHLVKTLDEIEVEQEGQKQSVDDKLERAKEEKIRENEWERRRRTTYRWKRCKGRTDIPWLIPVGLNEDGTTYDLE